MTSWDEVALPILETINRAETEDRRVSDDELRALVDVPERMFCNIMDDLRGEGLIEARRVVDGGGETEYSGIRLRSSGRRVVGDWPSQSDVFALVLRELQTRIDEALPQERTKLERVRDALQSVGEQVVVSVIVDVLRRAAL